MDLTDFKSRSDKKKVFDAMAAASIFNNSAGVDTSKSRVIPLDSFVHFLEVYQKEKYKDKDAVKQIVEVTIQPSPESNISSEKLRTVPAVITALTSPGP